MADYIGAIDQGTTSTRFIVFDRGGPHRRHARRRSTSRSIRSPAGWSTIPTRSGSARREVIARGDGSSAACSPRDLAAIGITNQRETTVLWNRQTGRPVHNALVWQDTRVGDACREFARDGGPDRFRAQDRPAALHLLQQPEDPLDSGPRARRCASRPRPATSSSATSIPSWSGISPAACTSPTAPTPAAPS